MLDSSALLHVNPFHETTRILTSNDHAHSCVYTQQEDATKYGSLLHVPVMKQTMYKPCMETRLVLSWKLSVEQCGANGNSSLSLREFAPTHLPGVQKTKWPVHKRSWCYLRHVFHKMEV